MSKVDLIQSGIGVAFLTAGAVVMRLGNAPALPPIQPVTIESAVAAGQTVVADPETARLTVFLTFDCSECVRAYPVLRRLKDRGLSITYRFPRSEDPLAESAARVAFCASEAGRLRRFLDWAFSTGRWRTALDEWLLTNDPDGTVRSCLESPITDEARKVEAGVYGGIPGEGLPLFVAGGLARRDGPNAGTLLAWANDMTGVPPTPGSK